MDLFHTAIPWWQFVVRSVVIYSAFLIALRIFGKREVGQFTLFDLVLVLLAANALQPAITGPDNSLAGGLIIVAVLFGFNRLISYARLRSPRIQGLLEGHPRLIIKDGHWIQTALRREGLSEEDCMMVLREHGYSDVKEVEMAVLETDGTISVVPENSTVHRTRHRVRTKRL